MIDDIVNIYIYIYINKNIIFFNIEIGNENIRK